MYTCLLVFHFVARIVLTLITTPLAYFLAIEGLSCMDGNVHEVAELLGALRDRTVALATDKEDVTPVHISACLYGG